MTYCDTHCHLDFEVYDADRDAVIERAKAAGLEFIIIPGIDLPSSRAALQLSKLHPGYCYAMAGFHPNHSNLFEEGGLELLAELAQNDAVVAIGEIGLDYYRDYCSQTIQQKAFEAQLGLALEYQKAVCIHNREASADLMAILRTWWAGIPQESPLKACPGVLHAYSAGLSEAERFMEMGFKLGLGGPITFKNADDRREIVRQLPAESLLPETDAPFLTPVPFRGRRNEPSYIPFIAKAAARLQNMSAEAFGALSNQSARDLFKIRNWNQVEVSINSASARSETGILGSTPGTGRARSSN
ncbi:MAG: TatD family hydrolase [Anaerolineaceae bacterium]|nr:TatD family hydrolase [Anaerolineaceae bacterium]